METVCSYRPGRLATFITFDRVTGVHGCLVHDVIHDKRGVE